MDPKIYGQLNGRDFHVSDFLVIHELGHLFWHKRTGKFDGQIRFKNHKWFGEFIADYYMIAYIQEKVNATKYPAWLTKPFTYLPFRYKTLIDFELHYGVISRHKINRIAYQNKFNELAFIIFHERKWDFIPKMENLYDSLSSAGMDRRASFPIINNRLASINPDASDWFESMDRTWHSRLLLGFLITYCALSILVVRLGYAKGRWISVIFKLSFILSLLILILPSIFYFI